MPSPWFNIPFYSLAFCFFYWHEQPDSTILPSVSHFVLFCWVLLSSAHAPPSPAPLQKVFRPLHACPLQIWSWRHGLFPSWAVSRFLCLRPMPRGAPHGPALTRERAAGRISEMYPPWGCPGPGHALGTPCS